MRAVDAREAAEDDLFRQLRSRRVNRADAHDVMQQMLNDAVHEYSFFNHEASKLTPQQIAYSGANRRMFELARSLRGEAASLAAAMIKVGLDERVAAVEEQRVRLFLEQFESAALKAGVSREQLTQVANQLRGLTE